MKNDYQYKFYNGHELKGNNKLFSEIEKIVNEYDYMGDILNFLSSESIVCCMTSNDVIMGFSWIALCEEQQIAELSWFVINKQEIKGLDGHYLLDKTLNFCTSKNIKFLKFNCGLEAWERIKNKNKLLSNYGYIVDENEKDYDISIKV